MHIERAEKAQNQPNPINRRKPTWRFTAGVFFFLLGLVILGFLYYPIISAELKYRFSRKGANQKVAENVSDSAGQDVIFPVNPNFGIIIPKININAQVIPEVEWQSSSSYKKALQKGVAHAKGTAFPGEGGNVFIFAHSGLDLAEATRYNAVFYLLNKLEKGDEIYLFYEKKRFAYSVDEKKVVGSRETDYIKSTNEEEKLTLMTCWPPGTTWKRLIVLAKPKT